MIDNNCIFIDINCGKKTPLDHLESILNIENGVHVSLVVFSSGEKNINRFFSITKGMKVTVYYSSFIQKMQKPTAKLINRLPLESKRVIDTHIKVILVETEKNHYIINSTSNLDSNSKLELTEITNNKEEYIFWENFLIDNSKQ